MEQDYTTTETLSNGTIKTYRVIDGTAIDIRTDDKVARFIAFHRGDQARFKFHYGDPLTGKAWGDIEIGSIGRSTGSIKIQLLISNSRSHGGGSLLDYCIVKIEWANKKNGIRQLYQHVNYHE